MLLESRGTTIISLNLSVVGRRVARSLMCAVLASALLASCVPDRTEFIESTAAFALTEADVAVAQDQIFDATFAFIAVPADPIWTDLERVGIPRGPNVGAETMDLARQDGPGGMQLGTITLRIPMESLPLSFTQVEMQFKGDDTMRSFDVGRWDVEVSSPNPAIPEVGETGISGAIPCGPTTGTFRNDSGETITSSSTVVLADGVDVTSSLQPTTVAPGEKFDLTLDLSCDTSSDFYIVSPEVSFEAGDNQIMTRLGWMSLGYTNLDDDALERISQR